MDPDLFKLLTCHLNVGDEPPINRRYEKARNFESMEQLKRILRQALASGAERVKVTAGQTAEVTTATGTQPVDLGVLDDAQLQQLFQFLLPQDKAALATGQTVKGALNVPNVGKIMLIGKGDAPACLRLYLPPSGQALFEQDWTRLSSRTVAPGSLDAGIPTSAPIAMTPAAAPIAAVQQSAPMPAPAPTPKISAGGYIPDFLKGEATPNVAPIAAPISQTTPDASDQAATAPMELKAPVMPAFTPPPMPAYTPPPMPAFTAPPAASTRPATIDFTSDDGGAGIFSNGQNPIDVILADMINRRASDVHLTCNEPLVLRIDGDIMRLGEPIDANTMAGYLLPIMPKHNQAQFAETNDTDFAYEISGLARFRVNMFRDRNGVGAVMRHIPSKILTADELGLATAIRKLCNLSKGLVVVTGPTGSGKSTTLAGMIDLINRTRSDHILTIEDPIEFVHPQLKCLVTQREVHRHTESFSRALRAALREDPDIVLIGEMRDLETIAIAIETAETGHLVFGTLHTTTAVSTVDRIVDQFPPDRQEQIRVMLSSSLRGVVSQTLLKKKTGGRVAAHEILITSDAVSAMIREGKNHMIANHMQSQKQDGNVLLNESLLKYVREGVVDPDEAYRKSVDKVSLLDMYKRANIKYAGPATPTGTPAAAAPAAATSPAGNKQSA
jgi:twitching motility protein PilT